MSKTNFLEICPDRKRFDHAMSKWGRIKHYDVFIQVVDQLLRGMNIKETKNTFTLIEKLNSQQKALDPAGYVADVVAKLEE